VVEVGLEDRRQHVVLLALEMRRGSTSGRAPRDGSSARAGQLRAIAGATTSSNPIAVITIASRPPSERCERRPLARRVDEHRPDSR
jgi:hypothetical protein